MRLACDEVTARSIADLIVETFDPAETAAAAFEEIPDAPVWKTDFWAVEVWFGFLPDEELIRSLVAHVAGDHFARALVFSRVEQRDWIAASLEGLKAVRAGRFVVYGSHDRSNIRSHEIGLEIEAALAFGTGHHGTTRGCLLLLDSILKQRRPHKILDIGTGTGVLAMAAAKALKIPVYCGDIDATSVNSAKVNAQLNEVSPYLRPVLASGVTHTTLQNVAPYDLIFANILARPLRKLAPSLCNLATVSADIVLSGLLSGDVAGVLTSYAAQGFTLARRMEIESWVTLLLRRGGSAPRSAT